MRLPRDRWMSRFISSFSLTKIPSWSLWKITWQPQLFLLQVVMNGMWYWIRLRQVIMATIVRMNWILGPFIRKGRNRRQAMTWMNEREMRRMSPFLLLSVLDPCQTTTTTTADDFFHDDRGGMNSSMNSSSSSPCCTPTLSLSNNTTCFIISYYHFIGCLHACMVHLSWLVFLFDAKEFETTQSS